MSQRRVLLLIKNRDSERLLFDYLSTYELVLLSQQNVGTTISGVELVIIDFGAIALCTGQKA
ncbi:MAG: hypothetical protein AAF716_02005 [Cyanobacteria bacterium P01_D01_bin.1]